jgi:phosphocarrier protein HPr
MIEQEIEIINKLGLHARASTKLTQTASQFDSEVWVEHKGRRVNAKSIMGVMMLAASKGTRIIVATNGADEKPALEAMTALINNKFGEGE